MIQSVEQILPSLRRPGAQLELLPGWRRKVKTERLERREESQLLQTLLVSKTMLVLSSPTGILAGPTGWVTPHITGRTFA